MNLTKCQCGAIGIDLSKELENAEQRDFIFYLKKLCKSKGITLKQLAAESGMSYAYMAKITSCGCNLPPIAHLKTWAKILKTPETEFLLKAGIYTKDMFQELLARVETLEKEKEKLKKALEIMLEQV